MAFSIPGLDQIEKLKGLVTLLLDAVKKFAPHRGFYSLNGKGHRHDADAAQWALTKPDMGLESGQVWVKMSFLMAGQSATLKAYQPAGPGVGQRKTKTTVQFNGNAMPNGNFILSHREGVEGSEAYERVLCIYEFDGEGGRQVFRFDIDLLTVGA